MVVQVQEREAGEARGIKRENTKGSTMFTSDIIKSISKSAGGRPCSEASFRHPLRGVPIANTKARASRCCPGQGEEFSRQQVRAP